MGRLSREPWELRPRLGQLLLAALRHAGTGLFTCQYALDRLAQGISQSLARSEPPGLALQFRRLDKCHPSFPVNVRHDPAQAGEQENRWVIFLDRERRLVNPSDVQLTVLDREQWLGR